MLKLRLDEFLEPFQEFADLLSQAFEFQTIHLGAALPLDLFLRPLDIQHCPVGEPEKPLVRLAARFPDPRLALVASGDQVFRITPIVPTRPTTAPEMTPAKATASALTPMTTAVGIPLVELGAVVVDGWHPGSRRGRCEH